MAAESPSETCVLRKLDDHAFEPFRRKDAEMTAPDYLQTVLLLPVAVARFIVLIAACLGCWLTFLLIGPPMRGREADVTELTGIRATLVDHAGRWCARSIMFGLGFYNVEIVEEDGYDPDEVATATFVSNHVSMLDIPVIVSVFNPGFVAKASLSKIPILARIAAVGGCIFVDRLSGGAGSVTAAVGRRQAAIAERKAHPILLFPEGTTTNGNFLMNFKTGAFVAGMPVAPLLVEYPYTKFSPAYDSVKAKNLLFRLATRWSNRARLRKLKVYRPSDEEKKDPKLYANNVRALLQRAGQLSLTDSTFVDKLEYQSILREISPPKAVVDARTKKDH